MIFTKEYHCKIYCDLCLECRKTFSLRCSSILNILKREFMGPKGSIKEFKRLNICKYCSYKKVSKANRYMKYNPVYKIKRKSIILELEERGWNLEI